MKISVTDLENGVVCVDLDGTLDLEGAPLIESDMNAIARRASHIVVNMSAVDYIASSGVSVLVQSAQTVGERGGGFAVFSVKQPVAHVLRKMALDKLIPIVAGRGDAVAYVTSGD